MTSRLPIATLKDMLRDRVHELVARLAPGCRRQGSYWQGPNPTRGEDRGKSFTIWENGSWREFDEGRGGDLIDLVAYCQGYGEDKKRAIAWVRDFLGLERMSGEDQARAMRRAKVREDDKRKREEADRLRKQRRAFDLWLGRTKHAAGDLASVYYAARGVDIAAIGSLARGDFGTLAAIEHWASATYAEEGGRRRKISPGFTAPAILWPIRRADPGLTLTGVHLTFLADDGRAKLAVAAPKLMLGEKKGSVAMLSHGLSGLNPADAAAQGERGPVIFCEGIETGLALALAIPEARVWAALDQGNLAFAPFDHACVAEPIIALDNDTKPAALDQRDKVLERIRERRKGRLPQLILPPRGKDFLDTLTD